MNKDFNNILTIELGPKEIKELLFQQIGFFKTKEHRDPNCCILGIAILQALDSDMSFTKKDGQSYFNGLKVYLDGDNPALISVGYNPFITKQGILV